MSQFKKSKNLKYIRGKQQKSKIQRSFTKKALILGFLNKARVYMKNSKGG